jgi:hypothetical protein
VSLSADKRNAEYKRDSVHTRAVPIVQKWKNYARLMAKPFKSQVEGNCSQAVQSVAAENLGELEWKN